MPGPYIKYCQVELCDNTTKNCNLSFFKVPSDPERFKKWMEYLTYKISKQKKKFICSDHFELKFFTCTLKRRLHKGAYPTVQQACHIKCEPKPKKLQLECNSSEKTSILYEKNELSDFIYSPNSILPSKEIFDISLSPKLIKSERLDQEEILQSDILKVSSPILSTEEKPNKIENKGVHFSTNEDIATHLSTLDEKLLTCSLCDQSFSIKHELDEHLNNHMLLHEEKQFSCDFCKDIFIENEDLKMHLTVHNGKTPIKYPMNQKTFVQKPDLNNHLILHAEKTSFICFYCQKNFKKESNFNKHLSMHKGEKPFKCFFCQKSFRIKSYLTKHLVLHTDERAFSCDFCEKSFHRKFQLTTHMRYFHAE